MPTHLPQLHPIQTHVPLTETELISIPTLTSAPGSQTPEGRDLLSTPGVAFFLKCRLFGFVKTGTKSTGNLAWTHPESTRLCKHSRSCCVSSNQKQL